MRTANLALALWLMYSAIVAHAQTPIHVKYRSGGSETLISQHASGAAISIDVSSVPSNDFIRVFDSANSGNNVGVVTLTASGNVPSTVSILIAGSSTTTFPTDPVGAVASGAANWGGLILASNVLASDAVVLAARVDGDVTGPVTAGQVFTLRAPNGSILGDVLGTAQDSRFDFGDDAVLHVVAGDAITGDVDSHLGAKDERVWPGR